MALRWKLGNVSQMSPNSKWLMLWILSMPLVNSFRSSRVVATNRRKGVSTLRRRQNAFAEVGYNGGKLPEGTCSDKKQHDFTQLEFLQEGSYGKVYLATACNSGENDKVVKIMDYKECHHEDTSLCKSNYGFDPVEIKPMLLKLPFIADLDALYHFAPQKKVALLTNFYKGGDLIDYFETHNDPAPLDDIRRWGSQVAYGLWLLHRNKFIHGDIKLENVFVVEPKGMHPQKLIIGDFGLSVENCEPIACANRLKGTPGYVAPNLLNRDMYGYEVDFWAHAVLMAEMAGVTPYGNKKTSYGIEDDSIVFARIREGIPDLSGIGYASLKEYLSKMLTKSVYLETLAQDSSRSKMSGDQAYEHPVLQDPFWHNETDPRQINEYWLNVCRSFALHPEKCDVSHQMPPPTTDVCPPCPDRVFEEDVITQRPDTTAVGLELEKVNDQKNVREETIIEPSRKRARSDEEKDALQDAQKTVEDEQTSGQKHSIDGRPEKRARSDEEKAAFTDVQQKVEDEHASGQMDIIDDRPEKRARSDDEKAAFPGVQQNVEGDILPDQEDIMEEPPKKKARLDVDKNTLQDARQAVEDELPSDGDSIVDEPPKKRAQFNNGLKRPPIPGR
eukprot:TRINITY_DN4101_c0_g1_i1.p1 TRINITY_DN4101_c0_g1~~TRINITY_DN4101_c0_g1_i1.p1  ORF type:complete len:615 (+),score=88.11 TRINITY_DN4101_c0_g1_i1:138-1982(+)